MDGIIDRLKTALTSELTIPLATVGGNEGKKFFEGILNS